jgi:hypothetical protein
MEKLIYVCAIDQDATSNGVNLPGILGSLSATFPASTSDLVLDLLHCMLLVIPENQCIFVAWLILGAVHLGEEA